MEGTAMSSEWMTPEQIRQRRAAEVMEGPLGMAIYDVILWTRKQWPPMRTDDELWLNPQDDGASVLIGGTVLGYQTCASERVPSGKALIYCKAFSVYVADGQMPDARFALVRLPL
jgi:hypothetical protein